MLNHVIVLGENHLGSLLAEYVVYYNRDRCHYGLDKDAPASRPIQDKPSGDARVIAFPRIGGLHHRYEWREAA